MMLKQLPSLLLAVAVLPLATSFTTPSRGSPTSVSSRPNSVLLLLSTPNDMKEEELFGGFTVKQRLREEVESPFRKVRLAFFSVSSASAGVALYFSALAALKANMGGFADAPPLNEALETCAISESLFAVMILFLLLITSHVTTYFPFPYRCCWCNWIRCTCC